MLRALERRLHSATAAPASSRCIRRRRRSTPQPLKGRLFLYDPLKAPLPGELDAPQAQTEGFCSPAMLYFPGTPHGGVKTPPYFVGPSFQYPTPGSWKITAYFPSFFTAGTAAPDPRHRSVLLPVCIRCVTRPCHTYSMAASSFLAAAPGSEHFGTVAWPAVSEKEAKKFQSHYHFRAGRRPAIHQIYYLLSLIFYLSSATHVFALRRKDPR